MRRVYIMLIHIYNNKYMLIWYDENKLHIKLLKEWKYCYALWLYAVARS